MGAFLGFRWPGSRGARPLRRLWDCQGGPAPVTRPFPCGWLPGSRELICYLLGRLPEPPPRPCLLSAGGGGGPTPLQKLKPAGLQAPPASPPGILPGFTFYGEALEGWAERAESGQSLPLGQPAPLLPLLLPPSSKESSPALAGRDQLQIGVGGGQVGRLAWWLESIPCPDSPPLRNWVNHQTSEFSVLFCFSL